MVFDENGDLITGDSNGNIFLWARGIITWTMVPFGLNSILIGNFLWRNQQDQSSSIGSPRGRYLRACIQQRRSSTLRWWSRLSHRPIGHSAKPHWRGFRTQRLVRTGTNPYSRSWRYDHRWDHSGWHPASTFDFSQAELNAPNK